LCFIRSPRGRPQSYWFVVILSLVLVLINVVNQTEVYHGYQWQTRVLDVHLDTQDPHGAIAMIEANRQVALQQQASHYQQQAIQQQQQQQQLQQFQFEQLSRQQYPLPPNPIFTDSSSTPTPTLASQLPPTSTSAEIVASINLSDPLINPLPLPLPIPLPLLIPLPQSDNMTPSASPKMQTLILPPPPPPPGSAPYLMGINYPLPSFDTSMHPLVTGGVNQFNLNPPLNGNMNGIGNTMGAANYLNQQAALMNLNNTYVRTQLSACCQSRSND
jgi:hypothetical protein